VVCHFRILLQIPGFETKLHLWTPGRSGGDHRPAWPPAVTALLRKLLGSRPPSSYSACASELQRRLAFRTDRASVRRWALAHGPAPATRHKPRRRPIKRWQVAHEGALWQDDTTPHAFLPHTRDKQVLFNLLDDATRYNVGARLYPGETLLAHLDFLSRTFQAHGLPLALYVDCHSFFYTHNPEALTQLGQTLHFYGVALRYAPTPQAKGKVERRHDYWRQRLPALLAEHKEQISGPCPLRAAQLGSLLEVFAQFKDPRRGHGLKHRQPFVLACAALAMLLGAGGYEAFEEECAKLTQRQLRALGGRPDLQNGRCQAPSDTTFFRVLNGIDAAEFDLRMGQWMMAQEMAILQSLAVDANVCAAAPAPGASRCSCSRR